MERCYGKTKLGFRCSRNGHYKTSCYYDVLVPVCKQHQNENIFYDWSQLDSNNEVIPELIFDFLTLYSRCIFRYKLDENLSLFISSKLFLINYENKNLDELLEILFKETGSISECPICYENKKTVELKCNHEFCKSCITQWIFNQISCSVCREDVHL